MFQIFAKKEYLVDHLSHYVDMHNHILPGIDDGAKTAEDSIALIKGFGEFGISRFIATPHIMHNYYPNTRETIEGALATLQNELLKNDLKDVVIAAAAEHMIDDNFESILGKGQVMPMQKEYLLVEMSFLQPPINFDKALIKIAENHYYPILAHPERYVFLYQRQRKFQDYKERGMLFQLNLLSLGDYYGKQTTKMALKLLENGLIDYVASDVHNLHQLKTLKELSLPRKVLRQVLPLIRQTIEVFY
ncbi:tyrosine-protein phosphatase [Poritiphilus flavus]|uniref:protein-tyrosine-phosphatase n=1 Tax=Poritiphilus flavus TaxID=2697053 RepID=A0A6L9ECL2_9FLAO|nr:CpsB/CapC family capsule biosynthesis tyrosine phosphatase [Poritiphilus flavus]NAS12382.1 histidinol phosphatase [Poritiphilus flavus]